MKVIVDEQSNEILGAAVLGPGGDEAVHCFLDTMSARAPYSTLRDTVHIHPTVSELIPTSLRSRYASPFKDVWYRDASSGTKADPACADRKGRAR
jgi:hypothetical protein